MKTQGKSIFYKNVSPELDNSGGTEVLLQSGTALLGRERLAASCVIPPPALSSPCPRNYSDKQECLFFTLCSLTKAIWLREQAGHPHLCSRNNCDSSKGGSTCVTPLGTPLPGLLCLLLLRAGARRMQINLQSRAPGTSILLTILTNSHLEKNKKQLVQNSSRRYRVKHHQSHLLE